MSNPQIALIIVRVAAAVNMIIHGATRLVLATVPNFDEYLSALGFPPFTAWLITLFELAGGVSLIAGKWVVPICIIFCLQLIMGIILIHFREGWFVVGAGRNGMEYSILMIVCLTATAIANFKKN